MKNSIPETCKGETVYEIILSNYVSVGDVKNAEQVFDKMWELGFPESGFDCQQMILLYKKFDKRNIKSVLLLMEENDVKRTRFDEKAVKILEEMEGEDLEENHGACKNLLILYAALGEADEVERIWKVCETDGRADDCLAAINAFGKVGRLYVDAGEVEKTDAVLQKVLQQWDKRNKPPLYKSFHVIMDQYSRRGDIHNTGKIFLQLRPSGFVSKIWDYQSLLQAYIKAKVRSYGFRERMADNLIPNKFVAGQLAHVDPFKKTEISHLLV
ncbi:hypothetical protein MKW92_053841 [Papaver armeniacum]|nr:hypothetical protein MKW92_053841 [Papaver armeniacum]